MDRSTLFLRAFSTQFGQFSSYLLRFPPPPAHIPLLLSTRRNSLAFLLNGCIKGVLNRGRGGGVVLKFYLVGEGRCTHKTPKRPYPVSSPNSWFPSFGQGSGGPRRRRTEGGRPKPVLHPSCHPGLHCPHRKKERGAHLALPPSPPAAKDLRLPGQEGEPAAPLPLGLLRALNFTECGAQWAQRREELGRESRAAARGLQASRPRSSGQEPAAGEGQPPPAFSRRRRPAEGPRVAEARPQLRISCWRRRRRRGRSLRGEREGGDPQEAANATECLHTSLRLPWLVKEPSGSQRGGRAGWGESGGRA